MFWIIISIIDIILFCISAFAVCYILLYSITSCWYQRMVPGITKRYGRFLIITTASAGDQGIEETIKSILNQQYDKKNFELIVVGNGLTPLQKIKLAQYPITLLCTNFENGTKGDAQRYAIENMHSMKIYDNVIFINPDEIVSPDFLAEANKVLQSGQHFFQMHRKPLATNNEASILSATMEEINNSIFRKGHVVLGMPSSLTDSALSLDYSWYKNNAKKINKYDEDKSLEALLLCQNIFVDYVDDVYVYVRPVETDTQIIEQRKRWMKTKYSSLRQNLKLLFPSIIKWNRSIIDKIISWVMIPRIILMFIIILMSLLLPFIYFSLVIKWWILFLIVTFAFALATPDYIVQDKRWARAFFHMPKILLKSTLSILIPKSIFEKFEKKFSRKSAS